MIGRAEMPPFAGKCRQSFIDAIHAFPSDKAVVRVAVVQIPVNDLLQARQPQNMLPGVIIDSHKDIESWQNARKTGVSTSCPGDTQDAFLVEGGIPPLSPSDPTYQSSPRQNCESLYDQLQPCHRTGFPVLLTLYCSGIEVSFAEGQIQNEVDGFHG